MRKLLNLSGLFVILYLSGCAFGNLLNAQGKWEYFNKDSLGVKVEPIKGTGISKQKDILNKWSIRSNEVTEFKNLEFFTKYDIIDQLFIEDKNGNVFYFHNDEFYSLSEGVLNIDYSLNADIIREFLENTISINIASRFEKPGAPEYEGLKKVFIDSKQKIWVINKYGLYLGIEDKWKLFNDSLGIPVDRINNIFENVNKDNSIWVTAKKDNYNIKHELYQYLKGENGEETWVLHNEKSGYEGGDGGFPQFDSKGNVWVGLYSVGNRINGFAKYDGAEWTYIRKKDGLIGIPSVFKIDKKGGLWYSKFNGTKSNSIVYYFNEEWKLYNKNVIGSQFMIFNIEEDERGNVWFSSMNDICMYDGNEFQKFNTKIDTRFNGTLSFFEDSESDLWIMSQTGLAKFMNNSLIDFTGLLGLSLNEFSWGLSNYNTILDNYLKMFEDSNGYIWLIRFVLLEDHKDQLVVSTNTVSYEGGIYRGKGNTWERFELPDITGLSIFEDSLGNIWIDTIEYIYKYSY